MCGQDGAHAPGGRLDGVPHRPPRLRRGARPCGRQRQVSEAGAWRKDKGNKGKKKDGPLHAATVRNLSCGPRGQLPAVNHIWQMKGGTHRFT
eukprot:1488420-Pyramimonas_sp.AAC.1